MALHLFRLLNSLLSLLAQATDATPSQAAQKPPPSPAAPLPFTQAPALFAQDGSWLTLCEVVESASAGDVGDGNDDDLVDNCNAQQHLTSLVELESVERAFASNYQIVCSMTGATPSKDDKRSTRQLFLIG